MENSEHEACPLGLYPRRDWLANVQPSALTLFRPCANKKGPKCYQHFRLFFVRFDISRPPDQRFRSMSNANLGEPTPPVNDKSPELAEINNLFPGKYLTREETLEFLRAAIRMIEANSPPREVVSPPVVVPAVPAKKPPRRVTAVDHTDENTRALQAFVALEMQSGKFPTMSAVCKLSGIGRGVMYKADRLLQFKEIYDRKEKEYLARKNVTAVRDVRKGYRQDRESGGGLEAVDFDDDE